MENFFSYVTKPLKKEEVDVWFKANNILFEKLELYSDFSHSLNGIIIETYLGETSSSNETKISLSEEDKENHFDWCWKKNISNFEKEGIKFDMKGDHYDYYKTFYDDIFYNQPEEKVRKSIGNFLQDLFDIEKPFTKSDLDMILSLYKILSNHMKTV